MISLVKAVIGCCCAIVGKRGELRYGDILPAPKLSSSCRVLKYLSSCVLLKMSLRGEHLCSTWQSQQNETISRDAHVSPMGFLSMTKDKIIGRCLEFFTKQKIGMTLVSLFFSLFLLFPNLSYSRCVFLPDAQWDIPNVSIDSSLCEQTGYTYYASGTCPEYHNQDTCVFSDMYLNCNAEGWCRDNAYTITSCSSPKVVNTQCPNGLSLYKYCVCPSEYKYSCTGTGYSGGSGTSCDGKYTSCTCASGYEWDGNACVCNSEFQYSCSGTGYNSGSGEACSGKYKSCDCSPAYTWSGSSCAYCGSEYKYACTSGSNVTGGSGTACGERYTACKCASGYTWSDGSCVATCNSSSSNWCSVHSSCHGDCCSDGTYESCDTRCGGSGCCKYVYYDGHKKKYNCSCYNDPGAGWCHIADVDIECWDDSGNIVATRTTNSSHGCVGSEARCLENNCSDEGVWIEGRKLCSVKVCD